MGPPATLDSHVRINTLHGRTTPDLELGASDVRSSAQAPVREEQSTSANCLAEDRAALGNSTTGHAGFWSKPESIWTTPLPDKSDNAEIWRLYVQEADKHDQALLKTWGDGIDNFLLFIALFSAILSAFLVVAWSSMQPDPSQLTSDAPVVISQQLVVLSSSQTMNVSDAYQPPTFSPPTGAVAVNCLWFTSLFVNLLTAVLAMLVKEWISAYNQGLHPVPLKRAEQRQLRYDGLMKWNVSTIITFLPLAIHVAVFLFLIGLVIFALPVSTLLFVSILLLLCIGIGLYMTSALLPLFFEDCPYRSPLVFVLERVTRNVERLLPLYTFSNLFDRLLHALENIGFRSTSPPWLRRGMARHWRGRAHALQVKAVEWMINSSDPDLRKMAVLFLSRWTPGSEDWTRMRMSVSILACHVLRDMGPLQPHVVLQRDELGNRWLMAALVCFSFFLCDIETSLGDFGTITDLEKALSSIPVAPILPLEFHSGETGFASASVPSLNAIMHFFLNWYHCNELRFQGTALKLIKTLLSSPHLSQESPHAHSVFNQFIHLVYHSCFPKESSCCFLVEHKWTNAYDEVYSEFLPGSLFDKLFFLAQDTDPEFDGTLAIQVLDFVGEHFEYMCAVNGTLDGNVIKMLEVFLKRDDPGVHPDLGPTMELLRGSFQRRCQSVDLSILQYYPSYNENFPRAISQIRRWRDISRNAPLRNTMLLSDALSHADMSGELVGSQQSSQQGTAVVSGIDPAAKHEFSPEYSGEPEDVGPNRHPGVRERSVEEVGEEDVNQDTNQTLNRVADVIDQHADTILRMDEEVQEGRE